jgi:hypothetical protein
MENHRSTKNGLRPWTKDALRMTLSVVGFAALLGPSAAPAQGCRGTPGVGCKMEGAKCGSNGHCETAKNPERECDCVVPQQPAQPPDGAITSIVAGTTCPSASVLISGLTQPLAQLGIANPDIREKCSDNGGTSRLAILIWMTTVASGSVADQLRNTAQLPSGISGDVFAVFMTQNLINTIAQTGFKKNTSIVGYPDIHLTRLALGFPGGNVIQTNIYGNDTQFTPTVDFTDTATDQLVSRVTPSGAQCEPVTDASCGCKTTVHSNVSDWQEAEVIVLSAALFPVFAESNLLAYDDQPPSGQGGGAGCLVYQALPDSISFPETGVNSITNSSVRAVDLPGGTNVGPPQKLKLVFTYSAVSEVDGGVAFHATNPKIVPRTPAVQILGPTSEFIPFEESSVTVNYSVLPTDFYGTLWYTWSGEPSADPTKQNTAITFSGKGLAPEQSNTQTINVAVNDSEGSYATATLEVKVTKSPPAHPR